MSQCNFCGRNIPLPGISDSVDLLIKENQELRQLVKQMSEVIETASLIEIRTRFDETLDREIREITNSPLFKKYVSEVKE